MSKPSSPIEENVQVLTDDVSEIPNELPAPLLQKSPNIPLEENKEESSVQKIEEFNIRANPFDVAINSFASLFQNLQSPKIIEQSLITYCEFNKHLFNANTDVYIRIICHDIVIHNPTIYMRQSFRRRDVKKAYSCLKQLLVQNIVFEDGSVFCCRFEDLEKVQSEIDRVMEMVWNGFYLDSIDFPQPQRDVYVQLVGYDIQVYTIDEKRKWYRKNFAAKHICGAFQEVKDMIRSYFVIQLPEGEDDVRFLCRVENVEMKEKVYQDIKTIILRVWNSYYNLKNFSSNT